METTIPQYWVGTPRTGGGDTLTVEEVLSRRPRLTGVTTEVTSRTNLTHLHRTPRTPTRDRSEVPVLPSDKNESYSFRVNWFPPEVVHHSHGRNLY